MVEDCYCDVVGYDQIVEQVYVIVDCMQDVVGKYGLDGFGE